MILASPEEITTNDSEPRQVEANTVPSETRVTVISPIHPEPTNRE